MISPLISSARSLSIQCKWYSLDNKLSIKRHLMREPPPKTISVKRIGSRNYKGIRVVKEAKYLGHKLAQDYKDEFKLVRKQVSGKAK